MPWSINVHVTRKGTFQYYVRFRALGSFLLDQSHACYLQGPEGVGTNHRKWEYAPLGTVRCQHAPMQNGNPRTWQTYTCNKSAREWKSSWHCIWVLETSKHLKPHPLHIGKGKPSLSRQYRNFILKTPQRTNSGSSGDRTSKGKHKVKASVLSRGTWKSKDLMWLKKHKEGTEHCIPRQ